MRVIIKFIKFLVLCFLFAFLINCSNQEPIEDSYATDLLEKFFILLPEMEGIKGSRERSGFAFDEIIRITFKLPENITPEEWLTHIVAEVNTQKNKKFIKQNSFYYLIDYEENKHDEEVTYLEELGQYKYKFFYPG